MTTTTQSNAIFRNGISLHVINVVDLIAFLFAYLTSVVISFSYLVFKFLSPVFRVKLPPPFAAFPVRGVFLSHVGFRTLVSTKLTTSIKVRLIQFKIFSAVSARNFNSFLFVFVMALSGTKFIGTPCARSSSNTCPANYAYKTTSPATTFPKTARFSYPYISLSAATFGAVFSQIYSAFIYLKNFSAIFTSFIYHLYLKRCIPFNRSVSLLRRYEPNGMRMTQYFTNLSIA